jgi:hypothetical protein
VGKSAGGLILKPNAGKALHIIPQIPALLSMKLGIWGVIGYPLLGIHREIERSYGAKREHYIVRSRIRQGVAESKAASQEERQAVLEKWSTFEKGVRLRHEKRSS